jgi:hypothetical protein
MSSGDRRSQFRFPLPRTYPPNLRLAPRSHGPKPRTPKRSGGVDGASESRTIAAVVPGNKATRKKKGGWLVAWTERRGGLSVAPSVTG